MEDQLRAVVLYLVPASNPEREAIDNSHNDNRLADPRIQGSRHSGGIRLSLNVPPRDAKTGFVFGRSSACDVRIRSNHVSGRHFAIKFNPTSGILLVESLSSVDTVVKKTKLLKQGQTCVIEQDMHITCGDLTYIAIVPDRGPYQKAYATRLGKYLGCMIAQGAVVRKPFATALQARTRVGKYLEAQILGSGPFGDVSLLVHEDTGVMYAGKRFKDPRRVDEVSKEISTLKKLSHKNIVRFIDSVRETDGSVHLIMEYLPGHTIDTYIFPTVDALEVLNQCLEGLDYIHSRGILHRDIKPENVVVRNIAPLEVCLVDFGLANKGPGRSMRGTVLYLAPEIWDGRSYGTAVDIWALGLTVLDLFGKFPEHDPDFLRGGDQANRKLFLLAVRRACSMLDLESVAYLVSHMLDDNAKTRWTAKQCLKEAKAVQGEVNDSPAPALQYRNPILQRPAGHQAPAFGGRPGQQVPAFSGNPGQQFPPAAFGGHLGQQFRR